MKRSHQLFPGILSLAALAAGFCIWSAFGNEVNLCVTSGCALFQDTSIAGISLWWAGGITFAALAAAALMGAAQLGMVVAGFALLGDIALLLLMSVTAPCVSCLIVACFFAMIYCGFRQAAHRTCGLPNDKPGRSALLILWGLLFIVNVGTALRTQADVWAITDNGKEATVRMFFSPSCPSCQEGIALLSGRVDVAFYPLAESEVDIYKAARMLRLMDNGASVAEALAKAQDVAAPSAMAATAPDMLLLRLRMLRNKAHVFMAGSQTVPFFEYHGLPSMLKKSASQQAGHAVAPTASASPSATGSADLPLDPQVAGQCSGVTPCQ